MKYLLALVYFLLTVDSLLAQIKKIPYSLIMVLSWSVFQGTNNLYTSQDKINPITATRIPVPFFLLR